MTGANAPVHRFRRPGALSLVLFLCASACRSSPPPSSEAQDSILRVGFGLTSGTDPQSGILQSINTMTTEALVTFSRDGRPQPWVAERWATMADGHVHVWLRPNVFFHDGTPVDATTVSEMLRTGLPLSMGPAFADVADIRVVSARELEFVLRKPSNFLLDALALPVEKTDAATGQAVATGPFRPLVQTPERIELGVNERYYGERPEIDRVVITPYVSVRAAWADLLRGQVDMLYEVGVDALGLLEPSTATRIYTFPRRYAYVLMLNTRRPALASKTVRRGLNAAIDRQALVDDVLDGHAAPVLSPVWPSHWALTPQLPEFKYEPRSIGPTRIRLSCVFADASLERMALTVKRALEAVGVDLELERLPLDVTMKKVRNGDFDAFLADAQSGPTLLQPYQFWHSKGPRNWGHYKNAAVDAAFDAIEHAPDDAAYKAGVAAFQTAIVDDPPAIFLAWSERSRAVSTRFKVREEPGRDILSTLRLWKPVVARTTNSN